jgi:hypothetical protein
MVLSLLCSVESGFAGLPFLVGHSCLTVLLGSWGVARCTHHSINNGVSIFCVSRQDLDDVFFLFRQAQLLLHCSVYGNTHGRCS